MRQNSKKARPGVAAPERTVRRREKYAAHIIQVNYTIAADAPSRKK